MQTQIHSLSHSGPFYLFKSATWSPSFSIKSTLRNCREQELTEPEIPFSSTLLLSCFQAQQVHNWAEPSPWDKDSQEWDMLVSLKSPRTATQHFFSFWRMIKSLKLAREKPQHSNSVLCCEENHSFHTTTLTPLHFSSKPTHFHARKQSSTTTQTICSSEWHEEWSLTKLRYS